MFDCFQMRAPELIRLDVDINAMEYRSEELYTDEIPYFVAKMNTVRCEFVQNRRGKTFCRDCMRGPVEVYSRFIMDTDWKRIVNDMFWCDNCEKRLFVWKVWVDGSSKLPETLPLKRRIEMLEERLDVTRLD